MNVGERKISLPENFDPYDVIQKLRFNSKADDLNFIGTSRKYPQLLCGDMRKGKPCRQPAGYGTPHPGYGRCKLHGGCCTGPKTKEGKNVASKNGTIHALYSRALPPEEQAIFNQLSEDKVKGLEFEINMLKTKIISYLERKNREFINYKEKHGEDEAYRRMKVYFNESDSGARNYYHAGTVEDRPLDRALNTLARLVEKHNKITSEEKGDDLLTRINAELKAASQGQVSISWGGKPQTREEKGGNCST